MAAEAGGEDARALAERLTAPLESALRLALLDALSAAADEITRDLAPGSVHLRLRGREPGFVVTPPPRRAGRPGRRRGRRPAAGRAVDGDDGAMARINLRLPREPQDPDRGGGRAGRPLGQRLAGPGRRRRARRRGQPPPTAPPAAPAHAGWAAALPSGLGPLTARPPGHPPSRIRRGSPRPPGDTAMPTFDTPEPITVDHRARRRRRPHRRRRPRRHRRRGPARATRAASRTCAPPSRPGSTTPTGLLVKAPRPRGLGLLGTAAARSTSRSSCRPAPASHGDDLRSAAFHAAGRLGECRIKTSIGDVRLDQAGPLDLRHRRRRRRRWSTVERPTPRSAPAPGACASADRRRRRWSRTPTATPIGAVAGDLRVKRPTATCSVGRADAGVTARRRTATCGSARSAAARSSSRPPRRDRGRHPRRHGGLAGREHHVRPRAQRVGRRRRPDRRRGRGSARPGAAPATPRSATSSSTVAAGSAPEECGTTMTTPGWRSRPPACASPTATSSCSTAST